MQQDVLIINKLGLHARASAKLTQLASSFKCDVMMSRNNRRVNAKSIMGVMMLAAAKGMTISIETNGVDDLQQILERDAVEILRFIPLQLLLFHPHFL